MSQQSKPNYYSLLGLHPGASVIQIRRAYRELSKRYHPDTTDLPTAVATKKFQQINEAYAILSNPDRRFSYDLTIGYSRFGVIQPPSDLNTPVSQSYDWSKSAYLDASDRPLSPGELFALFVLGVTFLACLLLAIAIGLTRGDTALETQIGQKIIHPEQIMASNFLSYQWETVKPFTFETELGVRKSGSESKTT
ncbi:MAG: J domain-containing protein [Mastigocoleus sp. MO_167.B18]|uniref:J domain-containing protein n=1 Tax=Mastigocoleus sp. MO_188.B34 TaxID=3036635 RepID=UPI002629989C|nr:J domain-containing protein [Mastigocoleus sp. MO_188.B34]MDJ0693150.1 J domain-containing protein [Mastigocoleus sp. MO_188.B34]MDJ0774165.1 J domain-containing protein [Mastigocoleus sp. MO_167.B18]